MAAATGGLLLANHALNAQVIPPPASPTSAPADKGADVPVKTVIAAAMNALAAST